MLAALEGIFLLDALAGMADKYLLGVCPVTVAARNRDSLCHRQRVSIWVEAGSANLAQDVEGAEVDDIDTDARIENVRRRELGNDARLKFAGGEATRGNIANQGQRDGSVRPYRIFAIQRLFPEDGDANLVAGAQLVKRGSLSDDGLSRDAWCSATSDDGSSHERRQQQSQKTPHENHKTP